MIVIKRGENGVINGLEIEGIFQFKYQDLKTRLGGSKRRSRLKQGVVAGRTQKACIPMQLGTRKGGGTGGKG